MYGLLIFKVYMERVYLCEFVEILRFAEQNHSISYSTAHEMFVKADKFSGKLYVEEIENEVLNYSDKLSADEITVNKIIIAFAKYNSSKLRPVKEFYIAPRNW